VEHMWRLCLTARPRRPASATVWRRTPSC